MKDRLFNIINRVLLISFLAFFTSCQFNKIEKHVYLNSTNVEGGNLGLGKNTVYHYFQKNKKIKDDFNTKYIIIEFSNKAQIFEGNEIDDSKIRILYIRISYDKQISSYRFKGTIKITDYKSLENLTLSLHLQCIDSNYDESTNKLLLLNETIHGKFHYGKIKNIE